MKHFEYFLYENYDAESIADDPNNPRLYFNADTDAVLSFIAQFPAGTCFYSETIQHFPASFIQSLIRIGILALREDSLYFSCPVFFHDDAETLFSHVQSKAAALTDLLEPSLHPIREIASQIQNGFDVSENLYHILCGMIFDGSLFDRLASQNALATSHVHSSGFDYLIVIYEKSPKLNSFSNRLLCSYNRFIHPQIALESFGDSSGDRLDFYRFFRFLEKKEFPAHFAHIHALYSSFSNTLTRNDILSETLQFMHGGICSDDVIKLLHEFGYATDGTICVPVFSAEHRPAIHQIESIVENALTDALSSALHHLSLSLDISAVQHGVPYLEIANELYHILFGSINEELVRREYVKRPPSYPDEGRYLRCIELY